MVYAYGREIAGYNRFEENSTVNMGDIVVITADTHTDTGELEATVGQAIRNHARPIVIAERAVDCSKIAVIMATNFWYDLYTVESLEQATEEYVVSLIERKPTLTEVLSYINDKADSLEKLTEALRELSSATSAEEISQIEEKYKEEIRSAPGIFGKLRISANGLTVEAMKNLQEQLEQKEAELEQARAEIEGLQSKIESSKGQSEEDKDKELQIKAMEEEIDNLREANQGLEDRINRSGPVIRAYTELKTSLLHCKVKSILYFKEVTQVRYSLTLLSQLATYMTKTRRLRVKIIVYDNAHGFVNIYKPVSLINMHEYVSKRLDVVEKMERIVITEPNPAILEDILKADYDVVIVLDRLKQLQDIVSGNNVYKYWMFNSSKDMLAMTQQIQALPEHIITSRGEIDGALYIVEVPEYKEKTVSARMQDYFNMRMSDGRKPIEEICNRANIGSIPMRTVR